MSAVKKRIKDRSITGADCASLEYYSRIPLGFVHTGAEDIMKRKVCRVLSHKKLQRDWSNLRRPPGKSNNYDIKCCYGGCLSLLDFCTEVQKISSTFQFCSFLVDYCYKKVFSTVFNFNWSVTSHHGKAEWHCFCFVFVPLLVFFFIWLYWGSLISTSWLSPTCLHEVMLWKPAPVRNISFVCSKLCSRRSLNKIPHLLLV